MKAATHAVMLKAAVKDRDTYFVLARMEGKTPVVHGFEDARRGLDYYEAAYNEAHHRGQGWAAGAILNWMHTQPRVFHFGTRKKLVELLGSRVYVEYLSNNLDTREHVFRCIDQDAAATIYKAAVAPRLVPA